MRIAKSASAGINRRDAEKLMRDMWTRHAGPYRGHELFIGLPHPAPTSALGGKVQGSFRGLARWF